MAAIGAALAFAANALSPRGLELSKNYFPGAQPSLPGARQGAPAVTNPSATNANSAAELLAARLRQDGLQLADSKLVKQLFHDPRRDQEG